MFANPLRFVDPFGLAEEHTKNARPSTQHKHEQGQARKAQDAGGEKGDESRREHRKKPKNWRGKWPPKAIGVIPIILTCENDPCNPICRSIGLGDCENDLSVCSDNGENKWKPMS